MCQHLELHCSLTVKILKIGTCKIITAVLLKIEQFVLTVQHYVQKMQIGLMCQQDAINPIALRKAKILYSFGLSECNRVNVSASGTLLFTYCKNSKNWDM